MKRLISIFVLFIAIISCGFSMEARTIKKNKSTSSSKVSSHRTSNILGEVTDEFYLLKNGKVKFIKNNYLHGDYKECNGGYIVNTGGESYEDWAVYFISDNACYLLIESDIVCGDAIQDLSSFDVGDPYNNISYDPNSDVIILKTSKGIKQYKLSSFPYQTIFKKY